MEKLFTWGVALTAATVLLLGACQPPEPTPPPATAATPRLQATATPVPTRTATPTPIPSPTLVPPTPTATPTATATPTVTPTAVPTFTPLPTFAEGGDLTTVTDGALTLHYSPLTAQIQVRWVKDTYARTVDLLSAIFGVSSLETTLYLLDKETYTEAFSGEHPEWTQGFARGPEAYINRAPGVVWDASVTEKDRIRWLGAHVQEITEMTHVALHTERLPRWLDEGLAEYIEALIAPAHISQISRVGAP